MRNKSDYSKCFKMLGIDMIEEGTQGQGWVWLYVGWSLKKWMEKLHFDQRLGEGLPSNLHSQLNITKELNF